MNAAMAEQLDRITGGTGIFAVLAVDHRAALRRMMEPDRDASPHDAMAALKDDVCSILGPCVPAMLIDIDTAERSLERRLIPDHTATICPLEAERPREIDGVRFTELDSTVGGRRIRGVGASAAKLLLHHRSDRADVVSHHREVVQEAARECEAAGLPLIVEPVPYRLPSEAEDEFRTRFGDLVVEAVRQLADSDASVLKTPFPAGDAHSAHCHTIDGLAGKKPWALLGGSQGLDVLRRQLDEAMAARASGFIVGRSVWGATVNMSPEARRAELAGPIRDSLKGLSAQAQSGALPWRER